MIININIIIITMIVPLRATILITNHYSISSMNSGGGGHCGAFEAGSVLLLVRLQGSGFQG